MRAEERFEIIPHPSDTGIIAYGGDLKELFQNAAYGMFSLMADIENVSPRVEFKVGAKGEDKESLLVNFLNELIFIEDSKKVLLKDFKIQALSDTMLTMVARGERIDLKRHTVLRSLKAATYNQLEIKQEGARWSAKVVFDV